MKKIFLALIAAAMGILTSCSKEEGVTLVPVSIQVNLPGDDTPIYRPDTKSTVGVAAVGFDVTFTNTSTRVEATTQTDASGVAKAQLEPGMYNVTVYGVVSSNGKENIYQYLLPDQSIPAPAEGSLPTTVILPSVIAQLATVSGGWVIKEVYNSGCRTEEGKSYYGDQYICLYNNSDQVLYADSLVVGMSSKFTKDNMDQSYLSRYLPDRVVADLLLQVPGNGREHPVQPGACLVIANQGLNHTEATQGASPVDMSRADFEWYDDSRLDVDVPEVPNMINLYGYSKTINILSTQSNRSYFILRPTGDIQQWMNSLKTDVLTPSGTSREMYLVYSDQIIDGVQMAPKGSVLNNPSLPSAVDMGFTFVGMNDGDSGGFLGLTATRRIKEKTAQGRIVLQDTNNSSADFLPNQTPSPFSVKE